MSTAKIKTGKLKSNLQNISKECSVCHKIFTTYHEKIMTCNPRCTYIYFHTDKDIDKYDAALLLFYTLYPAAYEITNYNTLFHIVENRGYEWINHKWIYNNRI